MKRPCNFTGEDAMAAFAAFLAIALPIAFFWLVFTIAPARGHPAVIKTPTACVRLAAQFGFTASPAYSRAEAKDALSHLDLRMMLVRDARLCRSALKREMAK